MPTILGQKVTGIEQKRAWRELVTRHGEPAPGPAPIGMRVAPPPAVWRRVPSWEWHRAGVGPQRSDTVMRVVAVGDSLERAGGVDAAEAIAPPAHRSPASGSGPRTRPCSARTATRTR